MENSLVILGNWERRQARRPAFERRSNMAETEKRERREHFRGKARPGRRVELSYRRADGEQAASQRASTRNIGVGGAFIVTTHPEPVGTALIVELEVPSAGRIEVTAEVRWQSDGTAPASEPGMGVKFGELDVDQLLTLGDYFSSLTGSESDVAP
jgi:Tfp pilus assembly protein PilZ